MFFIRFGQFHFFPSWLFGSVWFVQQERKWMRDKYLRYRFYVFFCASYRETGDNFDRTDVISQENAFPPSLDLELEIAKVWQCIFSLSRTLYHIVRSQTHMHIAHRCQNQFDFSHAQYIHCFCFVNKFMASLVLLSTFTIKYTVDCCVFVWFATAICVCSYLFGLISMAA